MRPGVRPEPSAQTLNRIARLLGWQPEQWRLVHGGYTPTARLLLQSGKRAAFAKIATNDITAWMIRSEIKVYETLTGPFMPQFIAADAAGDPPILIIEALDSAQCPPWTSQRVDAVLASMEACHNSLAPLAPFDSSEVHGGENWSRVAADPDPFLALGLADRDWLKGALPELIAAERACNVIGDAPCHWDVRSDNVCLTQNGAILIDWPNASLSDPQLDIGFWLPSLASEGGPEPEAILPHAPEIAAWICAFFAEGAGKPLIPSAPYVRQVQLAQLKPALAWVKRAMRL